MNTKQQNIILAVFGTLFGALLCLPVYFFLTSKPKGGAFTSVADLRKSMTEHDQRDVKDDGSVSLRSIIEPNVSDDIIYTLRPNLNVKFQGVPVRTNSFAMRGPETTLEKPADTYRIMLLGDSFAFGWGVNEEESFARLLEKKLSEQTQKKVEVLNFGTPGYSTFQEVSHFLSTGINFSPNAVLVFYIENDNQPPFFIDTGDEGLQSAVSLFRSKDPEDNTAKDLIRKKLDPNPWFLKLAEILADKKIDFSIAINPGRRWEKDMQVLGAAVKDPRIQFINLRTGMLKTIKDQNIDPKTLSLPTDPHPSPLKHEILANLLTEAFKDKI